MVAMTTSHGQRRPLLVSLAVAATAGVVVVGSVVAERSDDGVPSVSALKSAQTPLPKVLRESSFGQMVRDPSAAHLAGERFDTRVFLARGKDNRLCLLADAESGKHAYGVCAPSRSLATRVLWVARVGSRASLVAAIVPDGYTRAIVDGEAVPVRNNLFVEKLSVKGQDVRFEGPDVRTRTQRLG